MEATLREYRARRRRQQLIDNAKDKLIKTKENFLNLITPKIFSDMHVEKEDERLLLENEESTAEDTVINTSEISTEVTDIEEKENQESWRYFILKWSIYTVIWVTLYAIFLKLQFGAVFFVISVLVGICLNTRTRPRKQGEVSAYSVFNYNCKSIDGTLKAEQFEREIRYGAGSVR